MIVSSFAGCGGNNNANSGKNNKEFSYPMQTDVTVSYWAELNGNDSANYTTLGDPKFKEIGERHVKTAMQYVIRPDHSTYHTFFFDSEIGLRVKGVTYQGYRDGKIFTGRKSKLLSQHG